MLQPLLSQYDRWFLWSPVAMAAGIGAYFSLPREPGFWPVLAVWAFGLLAGLAARRGVGLPVSLLAVLLAFGFVLAKARVDAVAGPVIHQRLGPVLVLGRVSDMDAGRRGEVRALIDVEAVEGLSQPPRRLLLDLPARPGLEPGARIVVKAQVLPPVLPVLPGGFDLARAQWFDGIGGTGFGRDPQVLAGPPPGLATRAGARLWQLRQVMGARIGAVLKADVAAFAEAIVTGERSKLSRQAQREMQVSGLAHVISISGLHLSLVAGGVFWLVRAFLALFPAFALTRPIAKHAALAGMAAAIFYTALSGAQVAALRACLMMLIMFSAVLLERPALSLRNVALSALPILLLEPEMVLSASFQMSFMAVTGLIAVHGWVGKWPLPKLARGALLAVAVSLVAGIFSGVPALWHFNRVSPYSLEANLLAAPFVSFLVMPTALVSALAMPFGLEGVPLWFLGYGLQWVLWIAHWVSSWPGASSLLPTPSLAGVLVTSFGMLWACLWRERLRLWAVPILALGLALARPEAGPDVLVEGKTDNVALRMADGSLGFAISGRARFAAGKWLAAEGDEAELGEAAARGAWACTAGYCEGRVKGLRVLFLRDEGLQDPPCQAGDLVIATFPLRKLCARARLRIDRFDVWREGAHALRIRADGWIDVRTAQGARGDRPWVSRVLPRSAPQ